MSNNGSHKVLAGILTCIGAFLIVIELVGVTLSLRYGPVPLGIIEFLLLGLLMFIIGLILLYREKSLRIALPN